ncbi:hypothetical protein EV700_1989 [Fluviicoccus keumensis]|uniref:Uncharacterized protein n=1 Tax=Fluviicoccus keumensis TaxID=1435465 RepID=A0A4V2G5P9_9GAMM|nr:hypothetical protein EV700_1989 [Fluviicoccus keumensis]
MLGEPANGLVFSVGMRSLGRNRLQVYDVEHPFWWGEFDFEPDESRLWRLAGLDVRITRSDSEWVIETLRSSSQHEDVQDWELQAPSPTPLAGSSPSRYLFTRTTPRLRVLPSLADRSVVIKPVTPLYIPAGQSATLFVSTPVWLQIRHDAGTVPLLDLPVIRPSDTWFGPTPAQGRLCYSTKVFGRTDLGQLPVRPFRAMTPVAISNDSPETMQVERLCMPVPSLDIYSATDGRLWTPGLLVDRLPGSRQIRVRLDTRMHEAAGVVRLLSRAREHDADTLSRMFEHFLG